MDQNETSDQKPKNTWFHMLRCQGKLTKDQESFFADHFKPVNRLIKPFQYCEETSQVSFMLTLIKYSYNKKQINDLMTVLKPIIAHLVPTSVHKDVVTKSVMIPILDKSRGTGGSYSLMIQKTGSLWAACIYAESKTVPYQITPFKSVEDTLVYAAKNLYYFD